MHVNQAAGNSNSKKEPAANAGSQKVTQDPAGQTADFFSTLLDSLDIGVAVVTVDGRIRYANSLFLDTLWVHAFRATPVSNLASLVSPSDWLALKTALRRGAVEKAEGQMRVVAADLSQTTIALSFSPISDGNGDLVRIVAREVTAIEATAAALKQSEASRLTLNAQLLRVQDEERRRLARDLHDVIGQELTVTTMALGFASRHAGECDSAVTSRINEALHSIENLDQQVRTLSYMLHPPMLDENGLLFALRWFADGFTKRTGIHIDITVDKDLPRMQPDKEAAIFRVIQESLTNVFRHSGARNAWVTVSMDTGAAKVLIEDDGHGFGPHATPVRQGLGMQSMRGRAEIFGGTLTIHRAEKRTRVTAIVPLTAEEKAASKTDTVASPGGFPAAPPGKAAAPATMVSRKRVLIADDHEVVRQGIRFLLGAEQDFEICGEAADGLQAVSKTNELRPDLLILDVTMPHLSGFSVASQIRGSGLDTRILLFTNHSYPELEKIALASGCHGLVVKSNASADLIRAAKIILQGGEFYQNRAAAPANEKRARA